MIRGKDFSFATIEIKNRLRESVGGFVFLQRKSSEAEE
jgi:hypothetical protein